MHFHRKSTCLNGIKVLVILLITHSTTVSSALTPEEIADAVNEASPNRYCGKRLTEAMRSFCTPIMRNLIMKQGNMPVKKSRKSFDQVLDPPQILIIHFRFAFSWLQCRRWLWVWFGSNCGRELRRRPASISLQDRRPFHVQRYSFHDVIAGQRQSTTTTRHYWWVLQKGLLQDRVGSLLSTKGLSGLISNLREHCFEGTFSKDETLAFTFAFQILTPLPRTTLCSASR